MSAAGRAGTGGFTLIEMLVVLAVAGLVAGLAFPSVERLLTRQDFAASARALDLGLHQARADAVRTGHAVLFGVARDGRSFGEANGASFAVPRGIAVSLPARGIAFYDDGSSTGGVAVVAGNGRRHAVQVDPQSGVIGTAP